MILPFTTYLHYEAIYFYYMWHQWKSSHKSEALLKLDTFFFPLLLQQKEKYVIEEDEMLKGT